MRSSNNHNSFASSTYCELTYTQCPTGINSQIAHCHPGFTTVTLWAQVQHSLPHLPSLSQAPPAALPATWVTFQPPEYLLGLLPQGLCTCLFHHLEQSSSGICLAPSLTPLLESDLFAEVTLTPHLILLPVCPLPPLLCSPFFSFPQYSLWLTHLSMSVPSPLLGCQLHEGWDLGSEVWTTPLSGHGRHSSTS